LITNPKLTPGINVAASFQRFIESEQNLPPRYRADRTPMIRNLDALFDMTFRALGKHARDLLSILSLLSPDEILIELFLPRRQSALNGKLSFAKQEFPMYANSSTVEPRLAPLTSIVNITPALSAALEELKAANLIRWDHRSIAIHRVVQEAMNYHSLQDLQESFNSAIHLVYEAFPKQVQGNTLYDEWPICAAYITHAVHLSKKFSEYNGPTAGAQLKSFGEFIELLNNSSWYLYEISDYTLSRKVIEIAKLTCENKESHTFSHLCNTQGANYYDLNRVVDCRRDWELALLIREKLKAEPLMGDIAIALHNMGNLEAATGHYEEALTFYQRAVEIRLAIGDRAALQLGTTYLGIGRCHAHYRNYSEARRYYGQAEQLFVRTVGADKYFMAKYVNLEI
jgi:tetratricopeptide (TPR) repeat protein